MVDLVGLLKEQIKSGEKSVAEKVAWHSELLSLVAQAEGDIKDESLKLDTLRGLYDHYERANAAASAALAAETKGGMDASEATAALTPESATEADKPRRIRGTKNRVISYINELNGAEFTTADVVKAIQSIPGMDDVTRGSIETSIYEILRDPDSGLVRMGDQKPYRYQQVAKVIQNIGPDPAGAPAANNMEAFSA